MPAATMPKSGSGWPRCRCSLGHGQSAPRPHGRRDLLRSSFPRLPFVKKGHLARSKWRAVPGPGRTEKDSEPALAFTLKWPFEVSQKRKPSPGKKPPEDDEPWGWFDWSSYIERWEVPWGAGILGLGMGGWMVSTLTVGMLFVPQAIRWFGYNTYGALSQQQSAALLLAIQALETCVGLGVVYLATQSWRPFPDDLFNYSIDGPLKQRTGWLIWAAIGLGLSVIVNLALSTVLYAAGYPAGNGKGTVDTIAGMVNLDWRTYAALVAVVGVLAPLLEETVFRGFLLTTLTKWVPTPAAVGISSVLFATAHFSVKDMPFLVAVGTVWGFMYVRSKNLLTPILMHGCWNSVVLTILFGLVSAGIDIKEFF